MQKDYLEKVYAGFLGMNVGIRLGAPVEPNIWSYERIKETYGDIRGYVKDYINFLSGGCSKSPIDLLKGAGVDMTSPEPVNQALQLFGELLDEMEALVEG